MAHNLKVKLLGKYKCLESKTPWKVKALKVNLHNLDKDNCNWKSKGCESVVGKF